MKHSLLLLLALPLSAVAQYRPMYSAPRPSTPPTYSRPYTPPVSSSPTTIQIHNRMVAQRNLAQQQQMQQQYFYRFQQQQQTQLMWQQMAMHHHALVRRSPAQLAADRAQQQTAEQKANEQVAQLSQEQQRKRLAQPAPDAQQAAAQQKEDARQLTQLTVKNYQDVFLPGQVTSALQAQTLPQQEQAVFRNISQELLSNAWWSQQDGPQLTAKLLVHSNTLTKLTGELLGYDLATAAPVPAPFTISKLDEMLANDTFDQSMTTQLIGAAAQADKLAASARLVGAVRAFSALAAKAAATPSPAADQKTRRNEVKASMRLVNKEMQGYTMRVAASSQLYQAQKAIHKSTAAYLAKNSEKPAK